MKNMLIESLEAVIQLLDEAEQICKQVRNSFNEYENVDIDKTVTYCSPSHKFPLPPPPPLSHYNIKK